MSSGDVFCLFNGLVSLKISPQLRHIPLMSEHPQCFLCLFPQYFVHVTFNTTFTLCTSALAPEWTALLATKFPQMSKYIHKCPHY